MPPPPPPGPQPHESPDDHVYWRIAPTLTATLYVIAAAIFAVAIYTSLPVVLRLAIAAFGVAFAVTATYCARQLIYADADGIAIRHLMSTDSYSWRDIAAVDVVTTGKTGMTIALDLDAGRQVKLPPSLVLPATPHSLQSTHTLLGMKARQLSALGRLDRR
ncbi:MAG: hypothetical protein JWN95_3400 [Frankiales bacterium]|nr:hypothetical protein [Frankiales bacterium]